MMMNLFVVCLLGNHIMSSAIQSPDESLVVLKNLEDSVQKSQQYKLNITSDINQNQYESETLLLNLSMAENYSSTEPNEISLGLVLLDYVFSFKTNKTSKWHTEGIHSYSVNLDEEEQTIINTGKESVKAEAYDKVSKNELEKKSYDINIDATKTYSKLKKNNTFPNRKIVSLKINLGESNWEKSENIDASNHLGDNKSFLRSKSHKSLEKAVLNKDDEGKIKLPSEENQNTLVVGNNYFKSPVSSHPQEVGISEQDFDNVLSDRNNLRQGGNKQEYSIKAQISSSLIEIQQLKHKNSFRFHPNFPKSIFTNPYQYRSPKIVVRTIMPRKIAKRQVETEGNFPFSTAGSSLYGSYAYAHTRPSGIIPSYGGEGVVPIAGEQEEAEEPIGGERPE